MGVEVFNDIPVISVIAACVLVGGGIKSTEEAKSTPLIVLVRSVTHSESLSAEKQNLLYPHTTSQIFPDTILPLSRNPENRNPLCGRGLCFLFLYLTVSYQI